MRRRLAWKRWRVYGDPAAQQCLIRQYQHLAEPELLEAMLREYRGHPGAFPQYVRRLLSPLPGDEANPILAKANVTAEEFRCGVAALQGTLLPSGATSRRPRAARPTTPSVSTEAEDRPEVRLGAALRVASPAARPRRNSGRSKVTSLPAQQHAQALGAALGAAPLRHYPQYASVYLHSGDGEVVLFGRGEAVAHWYALSAETQGQASVQISRADACRIRSVPGIGPVTLETCDDHLTARREGGSVTVPARLAAPPAVPESTPSGGLILDRSKLLAVLSQSDLRTAPITWDRGSCHVGEVPVPVAYVTGPPSSVILDRRFLLEAVKRGTDKELMLELFGPLDPVMVSSGKLVALIARRFETLDEAGW
jgi:hypothetical protein